MSHSPQKRSVNWRRIGAAVLLGAFALPVAGQTAAHAQAVNASPLLIQTAAAHPGAMLPVIVQKRGTTAGPEAMIRRVGGTIGKELSIIDAVSATIPASALHSLAISTNVRWISPDAPVHQQGWGPDGAVDTTHLVERLRRRGRRRLDVAQPIPRRQCQRRGGRQRRESKC